MGGRCFKFYFFISQDPTLIQLVINSTNSPELSLFCPLVSDFSLCLFWPISLLLYFSPVSSWEVTEQLLLAPVVQPGSAHHAGSLFQLFVSENLTKAENMFYCCCYHCCTERKPDRFGITIKIELLQKIGPDLFRASSASCLCCQERAARAACSQSCCLLLSQGAHLLSEQTWAIPNFFFLLSLHVLSLSVLFPYPQESVSCVVFNWKFLVKILS